MNLVKWIRKNNRKIMVFVVIFCMVSFVIGYTGLQIIASIFNPNKAVIAHYGDGQKIRRMDFQSARNELNILRNMMSEQVLTSQGVPGALMAYLLFPDSQFTGDIAAQLKRAVQMGRLELSLDELEAYFNQPRQQPEEIWILLKAEATQAGYAATSAQSEQFFKDIIRMVISNQYSQFNINFTPEQLSQTAEKQFMDIVTRIMTQSNLTQQQVFTIFADLLSIMQYTDAVMNNEDVTLGQIKSFVGRVRERLDAEFVKINANLFVDENAPVSENELQTQFDAFKDSQVNMPTDDNPFGFGYKQPKLVQVEYLIILTDNIKSQIESPEPESLEEYYRRNIQKYQTQVLSDPNDQQSEKITQTQSFAEVEQQIRNAIIEERASNLANMIFSELKDKTEAGFEEITFEDASLDELQMAAGDYPTAAEAIFKEYKIPVKAGKTGWLSAVDMGQDRILSSLSLQQQQNNLRLPEVLLSVSADPANSKHLIGMPTIRQWQNIGPMHGSFYSPEKMKPNDIMTMVRVVGVRPATTPQSMDVQYDTSGVVILDTPDNSDSMFSLKEQVKDDILIKKAFETAEDRAAELAGLIQEKDWDDAIAAYNAKYIGPDFDPNDFPVDPNAVKLTSVKQQMRASQSEIASAKLFLQQNPLAARYMQQKLITDMLNNRLYDLLPENAESTGTIRKVLDFEPQAACYVVKDVTRQPATMTDYLESKAYTAMQLNMQQNPQLALIHLNPKNIIERMNYKAKESEKQESQTPATEESATDTDEETTE